MFFFAVSLVKKQFGGIKQDGLVHISQLADRYVASPADVVHLGQHVEVRVTGIDTVRNRIALSMRKNG